MICPACGFKDIEPEEHRCGRCGRRLDQPSSPPFSGDSIATPPPVVGSPTGAAAAPALAPQWKHEVSERMEQFRNKRARQQGLFSDEEESSEAVPRPDPEQKVIGFEEIAVGRIEPLIVERSQEAAPEPAAPEPPPPRLAPLVTETPVVWQETASAYAVAPLPIRGIAGVLDGAVGVIAVWAFLGTFHLMGGSLIFNQKALAMTGLAGALVVGFYVFVYTFYACETPGMQWTGLRVVSLDGEPPHPGQRLVRALGSLLSAAALGLGYLWAVADEEGLTWHDRMSKTLITRDPRARQRFRQRARL